MSKSNYLDQLQKTINAHKHVTIPGEPDAVVIPVDYSPPNLQADIPEDPSPRIYTGGAWPPPFEFKRFWKVPGGDHPSPVNVNHAMAHVKNAFNEKCRIHTAMQHKPVASLSSILKKGGSRKGRSRKKRKKKQTKHARYRQPYRKYKSVKKRTMRKRRKR